MDKVLVRKPVVAGQFYPAQASELRKQIASFVVKLENKIDAISCMLPHAGYVYSGLVATQTVSQIEIKDRVILIGPNHTGLGSSFSIQTKGKWSTPLGDLDIDTEFAQILLKNSEYLKDDITAHLQEHSLEVELPILQYFRKDFKIIPICILSDEVEKLKKIGLQIAEVLKESGKDKETLIVASSDMTHYEPQEQASRKDKEAINAILELDIDKLVKVVREKNITMCGFAPAIVMMSCALALGAKNTKLIKYATSGDITQDYSSVVGYAGIVIS